MTDEELKLWYDPKPECGYADKDVNPDTLDEMYRCSLDGNPCPMVCPNLYKCHKTSV